MKFDFDVQQEEWEAGTLFDDAVGYGAYFQVGSNECEQWLQDQGLEGNGYTILGLVESLCRLELSEDQGKYEMEAEADNTWVYGRDKSAVDRLVAKFNDCTKDEAGVQRLIKNGSEDYLE